MSEFFINFAAVMQAKARRQGSVPFPCRPPGKLLYRLIPWIRSFAQTDGWNLIRTSLAVRMSTGVAEK